MALPKPRNPTPDCRLPTAATLPRHLYRFILRLLRPAEAAARRLIIAASRGLTVPVPKLPPRPEPKPQTMEPFMRKLGLAVMMPRGGHAGSSPAKRGVSGRFAEGKSVVPAARWKASERRDAASAAGTRPAGTAGGGGGGAEPAAGRLPAFPLFDPPRRILLGGRTRRRYTPPHAGPRICVPGFTELRRLPPPPSPDDPIDAARLGQRIAALAAALDDLPGQARRFACWKARSDAIGARERELAASGGQDAGRDPVRFRRTWPLRRGRPPGGRLSRWDPDASRDATGAPGRKSPRNIREIDEILAHAHALAVHALEYPDTS